MAQSLRGTAITAKIGEKRPREGSGYKVIVSPEPYPKLVLAVLGELASLLRHPGLAKAIEEVVQVLSVPVKLRQDCLGVCDGRIMPL
jgi:hypothetical protein